MTLQDYRRTQERRWSCRNLRSLDVLGSGGVDNLILPNTPSPSLDMSTAISSAGVLNQVGNDQTSFDDVDRRYYIGTKPTSEEEEL